MRPVLDGQRGGAESLQDAASMKHLHYAGQEWRRWREIVENVTPEEVATERPGEIAKLGQPAKDKLGIRVDG